MKGTLDRKDGERCPGHSITYRVPGMFQNPHTPMKLRSSIRTRSVGPRPGESGEGKETETGDLAERITDAGRRRTSSPAAGRSQDGVLIELLNPRALFRGMPRSRASDKMKRFPFRQPRKGREDLAGGVSPRWEYSYSAKPQRGDRTLRSASAAPSGLSGFLCPRTGDWRPRPLTDAPHGASCQRQQLNWSSRRRRPTASDSSPAPRCSTAGAGPCPCFREAGSTAGTTRVTSSAST